MSKLIPANDFSEITQLIELYWAVGEYVSQKISVETWGKVTVELVAAYIQQRAV